MFQPELVMIDVDGTLVDSVPDLAWCVDQTMIAVGRAPHGENKVRQWVGNGVVRLVERALADDLNAAHDAEIFNQAMPIFMDLYADNTSKRSHLYPGVVEGMAYLKSLNVKLGCITNKAEVFTLPLLKAMGIHDDFEIIICGDTLEKKKPHPMPLLHGAKQLGVRPERALMLGDSRSDVVAARAAGFAIICMSYGYNHGNDIRDENPDVVIDTMKDLPQYIS